MPRLRDLFPATAVDRRLTVPWDKEASIDPRVGLAKDVLVLEQLVIEAPDPDDLHDLAQLLRRDLVAMKTSASPVARHVLNFIQFRLATRAANAFTGIGATQRVYDWLVYSLVDGESVSGTLNFCLSRIPESIQSREPLVSADASETMLEWSSAYFYYSRCQGALGGLVADDEWLLAFIEDFLLTAFPRSLIALLHYLEWTLPYAPTRTEPVLRFIEDQYDRKQLDRHGNKVVAMALAVTAAPQARRSGRDVAEHMLQEFADVLDDLERLQLRVRAAANDANAIRDALPLLMADVRAFNSYLAENAIPDQPHIITDMRSRAFGVIGPAITILLRAGYCRDAQVLLAAWREVPPERARADPGMAIVPIHEGGALAAIEGASTWPHDGASGDPGGMTQALNAFLGTTIVFTDDPNFILAAPGRGHGVPDASAAPAFRSAVTRELHPERIARLVEVHGDGQASCLTVVPGGQWPLQPVLLRELGWTAPLAKSLEAPETDRPLKSALIVVAGSYQGEAECEAVQGIFEAAHIHVDVLRGDGAAKDAVLSAYSSDRYDVLWIISHGEFDHFEAHQGGIVLHDGVLAYADLRTVLAPAGQRRLLVLNLCDGGATGWRGLHEVGVGAAACSGSQAVITHLWPVDPLLTAVLGALLAGELASGRGWFPAFERLLRTLLDGKESMLVRLRELTGDGELARRFGNASVDPTEFHHWGSAAFLE